MVAGVLRSDGSNKSRILAALSYMGILCFVPLVTNQDDEFVHFHAKQGLVIWMWGVLAIFALHFPGVGKWFFSFSVMAVMGFSVLGILSVILNRAWKLPIVSYFSTRM